jgi:hypothetical protein
VENFDSGSHDIHLTVDRVTALQALSDGSLWVGQGEAGFDIINTRTHEQMHVTILPGEELTGLLPYGNDQMIALTRHNLVLYDKYGSDNTCCPSYTPL